MAIPDTSGGTSKHVFIRVDGQRTSVRLYDDEIRALELVCRAKGQDLDDYCTSVAHDPDRNELSLTARLRGSVIAFLLEKWLSSDDQA